MAKGHRGQQKFCFSKGLFTIRIAKLQQKQRQVRKIKFQGEERAGTVDYRYVGRGRRETAEGVLL